MSEDMTIQSARSIVDGSAAYKDPADWDVAKGFIAAWEQQQKKIDQLMAGIPFTKEEIENARLVAEARIKSFKFDGDQEKLKIAREALELIKSHKYDSEILACQFTAGKADEALRRIG